MRVLLICILLSQWIYVAVAQDSDPNADLNSANTTCSFEDGQELSIRYKRSEKQEDMHNGKPWEPGGAAMMLFTPAALIVGNTEIPAGAYRLFVIPEKKSWTFVVNKNVSSGSQYDAAQDLVREPMELGQIDVPLKQPDIGLAHVAPKKCNLRVYFGRVGASAEISEK
jgi:hypothetical protein